MNPRTVARLVGGVIIIFNLWLIGQYRIEGVMVLVLTFGVAAAFELLIVRSLSSAERTEKRATPASQGQVSVAASPPLPPSEEHWKQSLSEFESAARRTGLWGRCFADAAGNEAVTKAKYLQVRAAEVAASELAIAQEAARAMEAKRSAEEEAIRLTAKREYDAKPKGICPNCKKLILRDTLECPHCYARFGKDPAWRVLHPGET